MIGRAEAASYNEGSLKDLPAAWAASAFEQRETSFALREPYRSVVTFKVQDVRTALPDGPFDLILCRNLVFTYFDEALQHTILKRLAARLHSGGALVIGSHERLPDDGASLSTWSKHHCVYRKSCKR